MTRIARSRRRLASFLVPALMQCAVLHGAAANAATPSQDNAPPAAKPAQSERPAGKDIVMRGVEAIGGKDAYAKRKSIEMRGRIEMPAQGLKGRMLSRTAHPNRMYTEMEFEGLGIFRTGFDGTVGWSSDKIQGARLVEGKELETIAREADYMKDADPLARWDSLETTGEGEFSGFDCWKITASRSRKPADAEAQGEEKGEAQEEVKEEGKGEAKGETKGEGKGEAQSDTGASERATLWYEKSTGLLRGYDTTVETMIGTLSVSTAFLEYRDFDGLKLPVRSEATQAGQKIVTVFESVTFDSVDAKAFELPPEIKALLEPEPAEDDENDGDDSGEAKP